MEITQTQWKAYIKELDKVNAVAAEEMRRYVVSIGGWSRAYNHQKIIDYAYGLATKYGEASATMSALMYDAVAALSGVSVPAAVPADTATLDEVVDNIYRAAMFSEKTIPDAVGRMVKRAGQQTTVNNAKRDGAQCAWVTSGDTCAFCLTLASNGWTSPKPRDLHIHTHCDCAYAVRFDKKGGVAGYDPQKYKEIYNDAEGYTSKDKINYMRRQAYAEDKERINEQKRANYAERKAAESELIELAP